LYNVAARDACEAARCASSGDLDEAARLAARAAQGHERAAAAGSADAMLNVGVLRYNAGDFEGAAAFWRRAAERGKGNACRYYARCLTNGQGVKSDQNAARRWLRRGAAAGDASSAYSLYLAGVDADKHLAAAAASGHAGACVDLARTASSREALTLLRRAVHNGGAAAAYCALGRLFLGTPGLARNLTASADFFARSGTAESQACLSGLYGRVLRPLVDPTPPPSRDVKLLLW